jgi:RNA polymerase sigma-70 factor (ECF subfamily)
MAEAGTPERGLREADLAMERYANGDDAAFPQLYDLLAPRLYGYLLRQTRDRARAEDVLQQTLLQLHRARGSFCPGAEVLPWTFAIARRLLIDAHRRGRGEVLAGDRAQVEEAEEPAAGSGGPEAQLEASRLAERLHAELLRLPEPQRVAFELVRQEGLSMAEAAQALGTTVNAVKLRASRAYRALRAVLGEPAPGPEEFE